MSINIIEPYARLVGPNLPTDPFTKEDGVRLLRRIEYFARISHASEDTQTEDSWDRFLRTVVIGHGDWSVVEHASVTVDVVTDRGVSHEWVRHRLFSYTQASTRFINYAKKMPPSFIHPGEDEGYRIDHETGTALCWLKGDGEKAWQEAMDQCVDSYKRILATGAPPQIARSVFPNALATRYAVTGNLRSWRHLFTMRTTKETHPQFRQVSIPLLEEFKAKIPILFEDIEPGVRQADGMKKAR